MKWGTVAAEMREGEVEAKKEAETGALEAGS